MIGRRPEKGPGHEGRSPEMVQRFSVQVGAIMRTGPAPISDIFTKKSYLVESDSKNAAGQAALDAFHAEHPQLMGRVERNQNVTNCALYQGKASDIILPPTVTVKAQGAKMPIYLTADQIETVQTCLMHCFKNRVNLGNAWASVAKERNRFGTLKNPNGERYAECYKGMADLIHGIIADIEQQLKP